MVQQFEPALAGESGLSPTLWAPGAYLNRFPGACAPGFILSPASPAGSLTASFAGWVFDSIPVRRLGL